MEVGMVKIKKAQEYNDILLVWHLNAWGWETVLTFHCIPFEFCILCVIYLF